MQTLETSEDIKTNILNYRVTLIQDKHNLQEKQKQLLSIFDNANDDFDINQIQSVVTDIKNEISYQKNKESAKKASVDDFVKQENYKRKHRFKTWLKSCIRKPFPTWRDDTGELMCIVAGLIMGWMCRLIAFGADSDIGMRACFMFGGICGFCLSIPSAIKAFREKEGSKFGVFYFFTELIILIGSIIWYCLYWLV